ncbi:hypothetical protein BOTNAR_0195g00150 [Botryotinia narcissicola]|uniref:Uncharacterized protein n=1 Tax=Botryotinia narcissicola TaxID=278944 RepID=A0A4Z1IF74_9HELO|nr:hypothetical protein BOTNAR_0195g00150 [Botryotinia narcissicola]
MSGSSEPSRGADYLLALTMFEVWYFPLHNTRTRYSDCHQSGTFSIVNDRFYCHGDDLSDGTQDSDALSTSTGRLIVLAVLLSPVS